MNNEIAVRDLEEQVIARAVKQIGGYIKKRKKAIAYWYEDEARLMELVECNGLNTFQISKHLFEPLVKSSRVVKQYNAIELGLVLDFYQDILIKLNEHTLYPPQLEHYCRLLGISTKTFKDQYLNNGRDESLRNAAQQVIDYISGALSYAGMTRQIDNNAQIFVQKSNLNKKDIEQSVTNNYNNSILLTPEQFADKLANLEKGNK